MYSITNDVVCLPCLFHIGIWSPQLGAMAGVNVPLVGMHHAYVVTECIDGIQNMPNVRDHDASIYLKLQGDALSVGGYEPNPIFMEQVRAGLRYNSKRHILHAVELLQ